MPEKTLEKPLQPFHETIIEAISHASTREMEFLAPIIKTTQIPKNHDAIIAAWQKRRTEMSWGEEDLGVTANLTEQKELAASEEKKKKEAPKCERCKDTGRIYINKEDWPCDCRAGDHTLFSVPGVDGGLTGIEMRKYIKRPGF